MQLILESKLIKIINDKLKETEKEKGHTQIYTSSNHQ